MRIPELLLVLLFPVLAFSAEGSDVPPSTILPWTQPVIQQNYYWRVTEIKGGAELLTLFCRYREDQITKIGKGSDTGEVPLVAILRDTLGDDNPANDKLRHVWMLSYASPTLEQRILSAVPFFYWRTGLGRSDSETMPKPLIDINSPEGRVWKNVGRASLQAMMFDPMTTPIRASSRAYNFNDVNHWQLQVNRLLSLLEQDPDSQISSALSEQERATIIGRLYLSKKFLGGLVREEKLPQIREKQWAQLEITREQNWELLRQTAENAGLVFEPLNLAEKGEAFAALWFPLDRKGEPSTLPESWSLLGISNPWKDGRLKQWKSFKQTRFFGEQEELLPAGISNGKPRELIPLAIYSLTHPRTPFVLVDFRHQSHPKRRELTRRTVSDVASGVFGLTTFGNWYFYAANLGFQFIVGRHGGAVDRAARNESYARFQVALELDRTVDPSFKAEIQRRFNDLSLNPLENSMKQEMRLAREQFYQLEIAAKDDQLLPAMLDKDRRRELAVAGASTMNRVRDGFARIVTFGQYTRRAPQSESNLDELDRERRIQANLKFLNGLIANGTPPEIAIDSAKIESTIKELTLLASRESNGRLRQKAESMLSRMQAASKDAGLRAECANALAQLTVDKPNPAPLDQNNTKVASAAPRSAQDVEKTSESKHQ